MSTTRPIPYSDNIDLHYSPDDGGWYAQNYSSPMRSSQTIYPSRSALIADLDAGSHEWVAG